MAADERESQARTEYPRRLHAHAGWVQGAKAGRLRFPVPAQDVRRSGKGPRPW